MKLFLQLKHWQLFVLLIVLPLVPYVVAVVKVISSNDIKPLMQVFPFMLIFIMTVMMGWHYSVGVKLYKKLPPEIKISLLPFRLAVIISYLTVLAESLIIWGYAIELIQSHDASFNPMVFLMILPFHLLAIVGLFYILYFNARTIKTVEVQRKLTLSEYIGDFFLLWFFPIGVWFIQPRLNVLVKSL